MTPMLSLFEGAVRLFRMLAWAVALWFGTCLLVAAVGCGGGHVPPPQPPTPPAPTPAPSPDVGMLLRRCTDAPNLFCRLDGTTRVPFFGAELCCVLDPLPADSWPVNDSPEWRAYVHEKAAAWKGAIFFHVRTGPFFGNQSAEGGWAAIGGAYSLVGKKADLSKPNPAFWDRVYDWAYAAAVDGDYVELDWFDRWWAKQNCSDRPHPDCAEWNVQGYPMNTHVGRVEIKEGMFEDDLLHYALCRPDNPAKALGPLPNLIFQGGNEVGLGAYDPIWEVSMKGRVKHWEQTCGGNVRHLFGTNSGRTETIAQVDYAEFHTVPPVISAPVLGRPSGNNEYNPGENYTPQQLRNFFCEAQHNGTFLWYWRHGQTTAQMDESLRLMADALVNGCGTPVGTCAEPKPPKTGKFKVPRPWSGWYDTTWLVGPDAGYCRAVGYTDGRAWCPTRPECDPSVGDCPFQDTVGCNAWSLGGNPLWQSDGTTTVKPNNPFQADCQDCSWIEVCRPDGSECARLAL